MKKIYYNPFRKLRLLLTAGCLLLTTLVVAQDQPITLSMPASPLSKIFAELQQQSGLSFVYNAGEIARVPNRSVQVVNAPLSKVLDEVLRGTSLTYEFNDRHVVIVRAQTRSSAPSATPPLRPEERELTGTVCDEKGLPMAGVTIAIVGTDRGTTTDAQGAYRLTGVADGLTIVYSFVGYTPQRFLLHMETTHDVRLQPAAVDVENIVVTGIFTRKAESFTGSSVTVNRQELMSRGNQNLIQSLKNIDPSFNMIDNLSMGSDPNNLPTIEMRGSSSFPDLKGQYTQDPNQPLFILDGFETTLQKVLDLDMNRIESVTLLKDASAKAIYGSKAANGVVVIETVKLTAGEVRVNYTGSLSLEIPDLSSYNMCSAEEKLELERLLGFYDGNQPQSDIDKKDLYYKNLEAVRSGVNTDWLAQPTRVGVGHKHSVRLEVGAEDLRAGFDFGYNDVQGVMKGSFRNTLSGGADVSYRWKKFLFRNLITLTGTKSEDSPYGSFSDYVALNPYWRIRDDNGNLLEELGYGPVNSAMVYNPMTDASNGTRYGSNYFDVTNNTYLEYQFNDRLKVVGRFSFTQQTTGTEEFLPASHSSFRNILASSTDEYLKRGSYTSGHGKYASVSGDLNLQYNQTWGRHALFANAGVNIEQNKSENYIYSAVGFPNAQMDNIIFAKQYAENSTPTGSESLNRAVGALFSGNYSYDNRYLADMTLRGNASSQFGSNNRWGLFWSAGLGWNIHNEPFLRDVRWLRQLKIRGSVGTTGSQSFNSYQAQLLYNYYTDRNYQGMSGVYLEALANEDLKWQQKFDANIGFDMDLWGRLKLRFDYYRAVTKDFLTDINIPPSLGFTTYKANLGEILNQGVEFNLSANVFSRPEDRTSIILFVNGTHNTNEIRRISNSLRSVNAEQDELSKSDSRPLVRFEEGESLSAIWAVRSLGIDPASGQEIFLTRDGQMTDTWDVADKVICGDTEDKMRGLFGFNLEYKGLSVAVSCSYRWGAQIYNTTLIDKVENAQMNGNVDRRAYYATWKQPGDHVLFRNVGDWQQPTLTTSRFVQDYNRLDISSISIGYDFYRWKFLKKLRIERLQLFVNMNDVASFSSVKIERGTTYPFARTGSCTLIVNF